MLDENEWNSSTVYILEYKAFGLALWGIRINGGEALHPPDKDKIYRPPLKVHSLNSFNFYRSVIFNVRCFLSPISPVKIML